jgi:hypothetical protein
MNTTSSLPSKKQQLLESLSAPDIQRFWDTPWTLDPISGCHLFGGIPDTHGLSARFKIKGQGYVAAHRVAYFLYHGSIPPGSHVYHTCRNKNCINREHLVVRLTQPRNLSPQALKQSARQLGIPLSSAAYAAHVRGEKHPKAWLSDALAEEIHAASGTTKEIAERFGVPVAMVRQIKRGVSRWAALFPVVVTPDAENDNG